MLAPRPLPQPRSCAGARSGSPGPRRAGDPQRVGEVDRRDLGRHLGHLERHRGRSATAAEHAGEHVAQHRHHVAVVGDEAQLDVERRVLGQVPGGVVRLGPEHRPDLVDPLEDADHQSACRTAATGPGRRAGRSSRARTRSRRTRWPTPTIFGVWTSTKPRRVQRGPEPGHRGRRDPEAPPAGAGGAAPRAAWSSRVGRVAVSAGRYRSNGGGSAGAEHVVPTGSVSSTPAGAVAVRGDRAGRPRRRSPRSAPRRRPAARSVTTTWVRPAASRTMRKATDLSSRRRWTQPAIVTVSPMCWASSVDRMRCMAVTSSVVATRSPGRCGRAGSSRCHHTFAARRSRAASCRAAARECLRAPAPGHLHSCRWLSRLAGRGATRLRHVAVTRCSLPARSGFTGSAVRALDSDGSREPRRPWRRLERDSA